MVKRNRLNIRTDDALFAKLKREADKHGVTMTAIIEMALARYFDPEVHEGLESRVLYRLDQFDARQADMERDLAVSVETLGHYVLYWLTRTDPLPEGERDAAHALGQRRYDYFMEQVARKLGAKLPCL